MVTGEFVLYFDSPFWVGLFMRCDDSGSYVARHVFGSEPSYPEVQNFLKNDYDSLVFLKISNSEMDEMILKQNRLSHRQVRKSRSEIPKSLQIYKDTLTADKNVRRSVSRKESRERAEELYLLKREKAKLKKKGR